MSNLLKLHPQSLNYLLAQCWTFPTFLNSIDLVGMFVFNLYDYRKLQLNWKTLSLAYISLVKYKLAVSQGVIQKFLKYWNTIPIQP